MLTFVSAIVVFRDNFNFFLALCWPIDRLFRIRFDWVTSFLLMDVVDYMLNYIYMGKTRAKTVVRIDPPKIEKKPFVKQRFIRLAKEVRKIIEKEEKERIDRYGRFGVSI